MGSEKSTSDVPRLVTGLVLQIPNNRTKSVCMHFFNNWLLYLIFSNFLLERNNFDSYISTCIKNNQCS